MKHAALLTLLIISSQVTAQEVTEHTFMTIGEPSGVQITTVSADGETRVEFSFNDRGRGPETVSTYTLGDHGTIDQISITGKNYMKGAVDETFSAGDGVATWQSNIESGQAESNGDAFYFANNGPPELLAVLANAILQDDDNNLPLLPTGSASIEQLADAELNQGGETLHITLYGISGIDTSPLYVWLDDNGGFFGVDFGWVGMTVKGWEQHLSVLKDAQQTATDEFFESLSAQHTKTADDVLVIRGARIFDSLIGELTAPSTVFIADGKISAIYFEDVTIPDEATVIEAQGKTLMPSLWDMHGHVSVENYPNYLASGVTNVRDMANDVDVIKKLTDDVYAGRIAGPDIYALGFVDKRGEFSAPTGRLADSVDDAMAFIDFYAQRGFHGIKLYSSIEPEWVEPLASYAHDRDLVVMGHVPAYMNAEQAIAAGYNEITHLNMILLNFLGAEELDTRTPTRFIVPGEKAGDLDLQSAEFLEFIALMKANNVAHDPTLSIFLDMFLNTPGEISPVFDGIADHFPANTRRGLINGSGYNDGKEEAFARAAERSLELVRVLHENDIRILPGTDNALPGFTLIRELMFYVQAGIPANEALQIATIGSATHLNVDQRLGSVSIGKDAHLYIVDGDPVADISDLYKVEHVIKGRNYYFAPDLLRAQGFVPFTDN